MKTSLMSCALAIAGAFSAAPASAAVLNFDDLGPGDYFSFRANAAYSGFSFGVEGTLSWFWNDTVPASSPYVPSSGDTWLGLIPGLNPAPAITSAVDFVFDGASFAGYEFVYYKLYLNGSEVFSSETSACALDLTHKFCASGYSGLVDSVVIFSDPAFQGVYFAMDDFTYNTPAAIPEPGSLVLVAGALAAMGAAARRRSKAA